VTYVDLVVGACAPDTVMDLGRHAGDEAAKLSDRLTPP